VQFHELNPKEADNVPEFYGVLPIISKLPGFVEYFWTSAGEDEVLSINVFTDRQGRKNPSVPQRITSAATSHLCFRLRLT
jgi:hypothetical protein